MANLDEPGTPAGGANGTPEAHDAGGTDPRVNELERENARLRAELAKAQTDAQALWRTLKTVAPEYVVGEAEMRAVMDHPVPFQDAVAEAERLLGAGDGD